MAWDFGWDCECGEKNIESDKDCPKCHPADKKEEE